MHTGKVLFFAGSGNDELYTTGLRSVVWDYEHGGFHAPFTPIDVFCAHQAFLADGRLLVVGGTVTYAFTGLKRLRVRPALEEWIRLADMSGTAAGTRRRSSSRTAASSPRAAPATCSTRSRSTHR